MDAEAQLSSKVTAKAKIIRKDGTEEEIEDVEVTGIEFKREGELVDGSNSD